MRILDNLNLSDYGLSASDYQIKDNTLIIVKKNWDYTQTLALQEILCERVWNHKFERAFIFCSHPHCLTLGRGLQKNKNLIEFDQAMATNLEMPLYQVARGGGLTFHYPDQLVFYPVLSLETHGLKIFDLLMEVLNMFRSTLSELYGLTDLDCQRELLGLWNGPYKLASIGVSARRFVSYHGLALNLRRDPILSRTLALVHPCGLKGNTYTYLEDYIPEHEIDISFSRIQAKVLESCHFPVLAPAHESARIEL